MFEDVVLALFRCTPDLRLITVNSAFADMLGFADTSDVKAAVQDMSRDLFVLSKQSREIAQLVLTNRVRQGFEVPLRRKDGGIILGNLHLWVVEEGGGRLLWLEGCIEDVTERTAMEEHLRYLCSHDALTGLYNRWYFEQALSQLKSNHQFPASLLFGDIDDLKCVNDHEGHLAGDEQLRRAARALVQGLRTDDIAARIGGDEFAVLLPRTDAATVEQIMHQVQHNLSTAAMPGEIQPGMSFGIATAESPEELNVAVQRADQRMYSEKARHEQARL
jgi:diguanylate cyclase (GGDEF)-like protein/PAS domain S-box-containing protein